MWKLRIGAFLTSGLVALSLSATALAGSGGPNAGDVWVDNVGQLAGPGHEMDPHLACDSINLWGSGLTDASGDFTVDGWAPSGSQDQDYSGTWSYSSPALPIAVIDVSKLMSQATANGDVPTAQGFHFKLQFTQDPQKHKTFWLDCPGSSSGGGGGSGDGGGNNGGGSNTGGGDNPPGTTPATTPATTTTTSIAAVSQSRRTHHKRHDKRHRKHRKIRQHRVRAVRVRLPSFTG